MVREGDWRQWCCDIAKQLVLQEEVKAASKRKKGFFGKKDTVITEE
jgi:hypothetical protein